MWFLQIFLEMFLKLFLGYIRKSFWMKNFYAKILASLPKLFFTKILKKIFPKIFPKNSEKYFQTKF